MGFLWVRCFGVGVIAIFLKVSSEYFFALAGYIGSNNKLTLL